MADRNGRFQHGFGVKQRERGSAWLLWRFKRAKEDDKLFFMLSVESVF